MLAKFWEESWNILALPVPGSSSRGNIPKALPNRSCPGADVASDQVGALDLESQEIKAQPCCAEVLEKHGNVTKNILPTS